MSLYFSNFKPVLLICALYLCTILLQLIFLSDQRTALPFFVLPILVWVSLVDIYRREIPDKAVLALIVVFLTFFLFEKHQEIGARLLFGTILTAFFWLVGECFFRWRQFEGLGIGDAKLLGAVGFVTGPHHFFELLLIASAGGIAITLFSTLRGTTAWNQQIPFGPFVCYTLFLFLLLGDPFL